MSEELPPGWDAATLGEIGEYLNGRAFKESDWSDRGRIIIRIQDLTGSGKQPNRFEGSVDERHVVRSGDLLISWAATLGAYLWQGDEAVLNQHIFKVRSHIDRGFHYYLMQAILAELMRQTHGSGMVHITKSKFERTSVSIPPLAEQRRIVAAIEEHLSRLDAAVAGLKRVLVQLPRHWSALVSATIGGCVTEHESRDGWQDVTVGEIAEEIRYGYTASAAEFNGGCRFLRITDIQDEKVDWDLVPGCHIDAEGVDRFRLKSGDIVFARTGATTGKSYLVSNPPDAVFASYLVRVRLSSRALPGYVAVFFTSPEYWSQIGRARRGIGQPNVNATVLAGIRLPLPPLAVQSQIVRTLEAQRSVRNAIHSEVDAALRRSALMRQSILARAFSGQLVHQDPSDEPASVLLARIRAARVTNGRVSVVRAPRRPGTARRVRP